MIYAAFSVYLLGILFAAMGVYRLWTGMLRPLWVNWALLPGTIVAEMAYILGCLITGGEVRHAKLMGGGDSRGRRGGKSDGGDAEPTTEAAPKFRVLGPIVAAWLSLLACGAGILFAHVLLGEPVIDTFAQPSTERMISELKGLPTSSAEFWSQLQTQISLIRRMGQTVLELDWLDWRVPAFVYLAACLAVRLAPVRRSLRASLAAVVLTAGIIALLGLIWRRLDGLMDSIWPLVIFVWSALLTLLALALAVRGIVGLTRALLRDEPARQS